MSGRTLQEAAAEVMYLNGQRRTEANVRRALAVYGSVPALAEWAQRAAEVLRKAEGEMLWCRNQRHAPVVDASAQLLREWDSAETREGAGGRG